MLNPTITVFGGSGFLGRYLIKRMAARGYRIRVAVRRPHLANFLQPLGGVGQIVPIQANIRDDASTARAVAGADIVINLVGIRGPSGPQKLGNVNAQGARRVARLTAQAGVPRLIHVSMLGAGPDARSHMARSKAHGERFVREAMPQATIVRPAMMFGTEDQVFNMIASRARFTPVLPLLAGDTRHQPVYVGDVAEAILRIVEDSATDGLTYELAGPHVYTWRALVEMVLREIGRRRLLVPVPFKAALWAGAVLQYLPCRILAADDVKQFASEHIADGSCPGLAALGVAPTALDVILPTYLRRFLVSDLTVHTAPS
jgi:NADH dehydrogenase